MEVTLSSEGRREFSYCSWPLGGKVHRGRGYAEVLELHLDDSPHNPLLKPSSPLLKVGLCLWCVCVFMTTSHCLQSTVVYSESWNQGVLVIWFGLLFHNYFWYPKPLFLCMNFIISLSICTKILWRFWLELHWINLERTDILMILSLLMHEYDARLL